MKNHDRFLNKFRWGIASGDIDSFVTDALVYKFPKQFTREQLEAFYDFLGDSDKLNSLRPMDFYYFFVGQHIEFKVCFKWCTEVSVRQNYYYFKIMRILNKKIKQDKAMEESK